MLTRLKRAVEAFRSNPNKIDIAAATVRPSEAHAHYGRRQQYQHAELCAMFTGVVKVATSRTAAGVATNRLRVVREGQPARKSAWDVHRLSRRQTDYIRKKAGLIARNEARRILNMAPLDDAEADKATVNANNQAPLNAMGAE